MKNGRIFLMIIIQICAHVLAMFQNLFPDMDDLTRWCFAFPGSLKVGLIFILFQRVILPKLNFICSKNSTGIWYFERPLPVIGQSKRRATITMLKHTLQIWASANLRNLREVLPQTDFNTVLAPTNYHNFRVMDHFLR